MAVFVDAPANIRAQRVYDREQARWGERVQPGGDMYKTTRFHGDYNDFLNIAQGYETADIIKFGRLYHEQWISEMLCPVLYIDGNKCISENAELIIYHFNLYC